MTRPLLLGVALALSTPALAWTPNNPYGALWPGDLPWRLNSGGSSSITTLATVESVLRDSMTTWAAPACSDFADDYNGRTGTSSAANGDNTTVMGFLGNWPSSYGNVYSTIGITSSRFSGFGSNYDIVEADVSFNEDVWSFIQGSPTRQYVADLESIATHEFGHALGLGHSNFQAATMFASYVGGTGARSLAADDQSGVCSLYPSGSGGGGTPGGGDDAWEDNDTSSAAAGVSCGDTINGEANDDDWFFFQTTGAGDIEADLSWAVSADLDLYLFNASQELDRSELTSGQAEAVAATSQPAGSYYLLVRNYDGAGAYALDITCDGVSGGTNPSPNPGGGASGGDDAYEENDDGTQAASVDCPATIEGTAADQDWFLFETTEAGPIELSLSWSGDGDLDLYLFDASAEVGRSVSESGRSEAISVANMAAGTYGVVVNPYAGTAEYTLEMSCGNPTGEDGGAGGGDEPDGVDGGGDGDAPGGIDDDPFTEQDAASSGCRGCASTTSPSAGWLLPVGLLALRRRRRFNA